MTPKISDKPLPTRNRRAPYEMPLKAWLSQNRVSTAARTGFRSGGGKRDANCLGKRAGVSAPSCAKDQVRRGRYAGGRWIRVNRNCPPSGSLLIDLAQPSASPRTKGGPCEPPRGRDQIPPSTQAADISSGEDRPLARRKDRPPPDLCRDMEGRAPAHLVDIAVFCDSDDTHTASIRGLSRSGRGQLPRRDADEVDAALGSFSGAYTGCRRGCHRQKRGHRIRRRSNPE
jgi:hypothetical protein